MILAGAGYTYLQLANIHQTVPINGIGLAIDIHQTFQFGWIGLGILGSLLTVVGAIAKPASPLNASLASLVDDPSADDSPRILREQRSSEEAAGFSKGCVQEQAQVDDLMRSMLQWEGSLEQAYQEFQRFMREQLTLLGVERVTHEAIEALLKRAFVLMAEKGYELPTWSVVSEGMIGLEAFEFVWDRVVGYQETKQRLDNLNRLQSNIADIGKRQQEAAVQLNTCLKSMNK